MARKPRSFSGNTVYHTMNRASARARIFHSDSDYAAFENTLQQAVLRFDLRLLSYIVMPNHFHLVLWPRKNETEKISRFMKWLQQTHTQRWHSHRRTTGEGRLYQGRFKSFPIQTSFTDFHHLQKVSRYVERNALRANLVTAAQNWKFSALWQRLHPSSTAKPWLTPWPTGAYPGNKKWLASLNQPLTPAEQNSLEQSLRRGTPFGSPAWQTTTAKSHNLQHTLRPPGRPKKSDKKSP